MIQSLSLKAQPFEQAQSPVSIPAQEARELIRRYPNLSEVQLARLINLYRELSALDTALMISDEELAPKLDRFSADHRSEIRTPFRQYAALLIYAAAGIGALAWAAAFAS